MGAFSLLFSFNGRINRAQYWLGNLAVGVVLGVLMLAVASTAAAAPGKSSEGGAVSALVLALLMLAASWCGFSLQVKRFHDRGRSGYWALAPLAPMTMIFATIVGAVASNAPTQHVVAALLPWLGVLMLVNLWLFIDLGLLPGANGPNKYDAVPSTASATGGPAGVLGKTPAPTSAALLLGGAQSAMDRAIAEKGRSATDAAPPRLSGREPESSAYRASFGRRPAS